MVEIQSGAKKVKKRRLQWLPYTRAVVDVAADMIGPKNLTI